VILSEQRVRKLLRLEVAAKVVGHDVVVDLLDGVEERIVDVLAEHSGSDGLDSLGKLWRSFLKRGRLILVLIADVVHLIGEVTEQEAAFFASLLRDLDVGAVDAVEVVVRNGIRSSAE
jgi:hypothetical protein